MNLRTCYGDLNKNATISLYIWMLDATWIESGSGKLLEELCQWEWAWGFKCPSQSQCHSHPAVYGSRNRTVRYFSSTTSAYLPLCFPLWWEWTKPLNLYANLNKIPSVYKSHVYDCLFITIEHWPVQKQDAIHKAQLIFL